MVHWVSIFYLCCRLLPWLSSGVDVLMEGLYVLIGIMIVILAVGLATASNLGD